MAPIMDYEFSKHNERRPVTYIKTKTILKTTYQTSITTEEVLTASVQSSFIAHVIRTVDYHFHFP